MLKLNLNNTLRKLDKLADDLLNRLSLRQREVLIKRFSLKGKKYTLEEIGREWGVTRERVRQVEAQALDKIKPIISEKDFAQVDSYLDQVGGLYRDDLLMKEFEFYSNNVNASKLRFLFQVRGKPYFFKENQDFYSFWYLSPEIKQKAFNQIKAFLKFFSSNKKDILERKTYISRIKDWLTINCLSISKHFGINSFGDFGLTSWPEINPKRIRDRSYLVLKKVNRPLHFQEINNLVNYYFGENKSSPQTVHNELIRDSRFVLVGRGIYALEEHGYRKGTLKELIVEILKKYQTMPAEKIVKLVKKQRLFQESSIILNLRDRKLFKKLDNNKYTLA